MCHPVAWRGNVEIKHFIRAAYWDDKVRCRDDKLAEFEHNFNVMSGRCKKINVAALRGVNERPLERHSSKMKAFARKYVKPSKFLCFVFYYVCSVRFSSPATEPLASVFLDIAFPLTLNLRSFMPYHFITHVILSRGFCLLNSFAVLKRCCLINNEASKCFAGRLLHNDVACFAMWKYKSH